MASLNLRDRILEATIVYVGGTPVRRRQTLDALARGLGPTSEIVSRTATDGLATIVLDVRPTSLGKVNGCDLLVHVVACASDEPALPTWVDGADGVVLLLGRSTETGSAWTDSASAELARVGERLKPNTPSESLPIVIEVEGARVEASLPVPVFTNAENDESVLATFDAAIRRAIDAIRAPRRPAARLAAPPMPVVRTDNATPAFGIRRSRPAATPTPATVAEPTLKPSRRPTEPLPPPIVGSEEVEHTPIAVPVPMNEPSASDPAHDSELRALVKRLEAADSALDALRSAPDREPESALRAVDLHAQSENLERAFARRLEPIARALALVEERLARIEQRLDATLRAVS